MVIRPNILYFIKINKITKANPIAKAIIPALIESCPRSGPTVLSSIIFSGAGNAPDLSSNARSVALILMLIYIWIRFSGWQFGLGAILAVIHDVILTMGFFSISQIEFNLASIAAILTIAGYSINDTVVVFDRIRENINKLRNFSIFDLLNKSINSTLSRTLMTSITTLIALISLYMLGGEVIRGFIIVMIWGVVVGTYSSIFIASPLIAILGFKKETK